jgi:glutathione peroxidase
MKAGLSLIFAISVSISVSAQSSFYDFKVEDIDGKEFSFAELKGKKVMIVNVASKCGYTPHYEELQELYGTYGGNDFVIIAFPANNFMGQEPGSNKEIKSFCQENYQVTFPMMSKVSVKGDDQAPLYAWLTSEELNGVRDSKVKWNFQKYCINEEGQIDQVFAPGVGPMEDEVVAWVTK